jgi:hypothetical protein
MDMDDLLIDTYEAIIAEAEKFNHDLTLQFGLIAEDCLTEDAYLESAIELIEELNTYTVEDLPDIFYDGIPDIKSFRKALKTILNNINQIKQVPLAKRRFED